MSHVAPHLWADMEAGRLTPEQETRLERHAAECERCAGSRQRITGAREALAEIGETEPPQLPWDHIGARIYWANSSARRAGTRERRDRRLRIRPLFIMGSTAVAAAGIAAVWFAGHPSSERTPMIEAATHAVVPVHQPAAAPPSPTVPPVVATPLSGVVVFSSGDVQVDGHELEFDGVLGTGTRVDTRSGQLTVQFDHASGFTAGPNTQLDIRAMDSRRVDVVVRGDIYVDVAPRSGRQVRIFAGDRVVEVKGTAFHVGHRGGKLEVECSRGRVVVKSQRNEVSVGAGQRLHLGDQEPSAALRATPLPADLHKQFERRTRLPMLPVWGGAKAVFRSSATLQVAAPQTSAVRVDGIEVGKGRFAMRLVSGRHHVEHAGSGGRWHAGSWVNLTAGKVKAVPMRARPAVTARTKAVSSRKRAAELARALRGSGRINRCVMSLRKQGLARGSFIAFDIGITAAGNVAYLNIMRSNLPAQTSRCIRDAIEAVGFARGPAATVRHRLSF